MPSPEQINRNTNPVPADKLEKKIANVLPTCSRRQFLIKTGEWVGAGLILLGFNTVGIIHRIIKENEERHKVDDEYPKISREQVKAAEDEIRNFKQDSERLAKSGKLDEIPQRINAQTLKASFDVLDHDNKRKELEDKVWTIWDKALVGFHTMSIIIGLFYIKSGYSTAREGLEDQSKEKKRLVDLVLGVRTDWRETPPTEKELVSFSQGLSYLPPVGGKIPLVWDEKGIIQRLEPLEPFLTAEQHASKVAELRQKNELGEIYVHQLTVQGRLPDRFKYVALALILNSPYEKDWSKPFFQAPWGKIAPLIYDGGNVEVNYNPVWQNVEGRTDFLERIAEVHESQLEGLERLDIKEIGRLSGDQLTRAKAEQEERSRLLIEARAYQRLGLALHCAVGTAPKAIPKETRVKLGQSWKEFEEKMNLLLSEYGILGAAEVEWFREKPIEVWSWSEKRREADWPPIQEQLIPLEEVKGKNPELRGNVTKLLTDISDQIDQEIGLLPKAKNSQN